MLSFYPSAICLPELSRPVFQQSILSGHVHSIHPAFSHLAFQGAHGSWKTRRGSFVFAASLMIIRFGDKSLVDDGNLRLRMQLVDRRGTALWVAAAFLLLLSPFFIRTVYL